MNYPLPPWLSPSAAQGYGELAQHAASIALDNQMQRDRLSQNAQQFAVETQQREQEIAAANAAKQEQLNYEHQLEQQKMQVEQQYKQQQVALQTQDLDLANRQFQAKTDEAAKKFTANQAFQKAMLPKDQGGEGLSAAQAALKYMSPYMTGTEVGRMAAIPGDFKPGAVMPIPNALNEQLVQVGPNRWEKSATAPKSVTGTNVTTIPVTSPDGSVIGNYAINPVTGRADLIRPQTGTGTDLQSLVAARQKQLAGGTKPSTAVDKTKTERKAEGGYKIGLVYKGGLKYLGGDPKDESSWEKVTQ